MLTAEETVPVAPGIDDPTHVEGLQKSVEEGLKEATGENISSVSVVPVASAPVTINHLDSDPSSTFLGTLLGRVRKQNPGGQIKAED